MASGFHASSWQTWRSNTALESAPSESDCSGQATASAWSTKPNTSTGRSTDTTAYCKPPTCFSTRIQPSQNPRNHGKRFAPTVNASLSSGTPLQTWCSHEAATDSSFKGRAASQRPHSRKSDGHRVVRGFAIYSCRLNVKTRICFLGIAHRARKARGEQVGNHMSKETGFVPIRRGILEHIRDGRLTPLEFTAHYFIASQADTRTGK